MTLPLLQEKAKQEIEDHVQWESPEHEIAVRFFLDQIIEETWNAAITEAIGALPEKNTDKPVMSAPFTDYSRMGYNKAIHESRTRLEALLKV